MSACPDGATDRSRRAPAAPRVAPAGATSDAGTRSGRAARDAGPERRPRRGPRTGKITVTRVAAARTRYLVGAGARRIGAASRADGADESGLTRLIWSHCGHYAADAMIAVCLAGTIFFSAARSEQRAQVALYLLVTMAPFALVAPFVGPALDRLQPAAARARRHRARPGVARLDHGCPVRQRLRADPAAFGALVLSKAYAVLRRLPAPGAAAGDCPWCPRTRGCPCSASAAAAVGGGAAGRADLGHRQLPARAPADRGGSASAPRCCRCGCPPRSTRPRASR